MHRTYWCTDPADPADVLMHWCCWCTDALMLLNQDQDLLADLSIAICSSFRRKNLYELQTCVSFVNLILLTEILLRWIMAWNPLPRLTKWPHWRTCRPGIPSIQHENCVFNCSSTMKTILSRMIFSLEILDPEASKANTERRTLLGRFRTIQRRSWERNG